MFKFSNTPDAINNIIASKKLILETSSAGKKLIFAGNGASASIASHASLDFTKQGMIRSINFNESSFITALQMTMDMKIGLKKL